MKRLSIIVLTFFHFSVLAELDANEIVKKADLKRGLGNISHSFKATITNEENKKDVFIVKFKDVNSSLIEQIEPERARGRKMLMKEYDMWLFTPNIKKPIRVSFEQKLTGEVANGDIARTNYAEDYDAKILGTEKISGKEYYKLELIAKNKKVTYGKIEYLVEKKSFYPHSAIFFALSGKALKKAEYKDFVSIKGEMRSTKMHIEDFINKNKYSIMVTSDHTPEKFSESTFNKDRLEF